MEGSEIIGHSLKGERQHLQRENLKLVDEECKASKLYMNI